jgi:hypothetical protein
MGWTVRGSNPGGGEILRFSAPFYTGPGAYPASYTRGTGSFLGVKQLGCGVDHPPRSRTEVKEIVECYLCSPSRLSWPVLEWTFTFTFCFTLGKNSSVGVVTHCGLDGPGIEFWWGKIFHTHPDRPWSPPSLLYNGYRVFPGDKLLGRTVDYRPPSSAKVKERVALHLFFYLVPVADAPDDVLQPCRLIVLAQLWKFPLAPPGILCLQWRERPLVGKGGTASEQWLVILPTYGEFHAICRDLLHTANLQHGTDGFTSLPKEGMLRIFSPWKIRWLWPGSNLRMWVPEASTLSLDHRSRRAIPLLPLWTFMPCSRESFTLLCGRLIDSSACIAYMKLQRMYLADWRCS